MNQAICVLIFFAVGHYSQNADWWLRYYAMLHRDDDFPAAYDQPQQYSQMIQTSPIVDPYSRQDMSYPWPMQQMQPTYPIMPPRDYGDFDDTAGTEESFGDSYKDYLDDYFSDLNSHEDDDYYGWYGYDDDNQWSKDQGSCSAECGVTSFRSHNRMAGERVIGGDKAEDEDFPWVVRVGGGCTGGTVCGATIISPRLLASAFHCTINSKQSRRAPCDHSDGQRYAIVGAHNLRTGGLRMPITEVRYPPGAPFREGQRQSHDFALMVLQQPLIWSKEVAPICLPSPDQEFSRVTAFAAGWGRHAPPDISRTQAQKLRFVRLVVSPKRYFTHKMFGTILSKHGNEYKDVCSGDSGGPLMYRDPESNKFVLIGTVTGFGYDCRNDNVKNVEDSDNGLWNKVSHHINWIRQTAEEMGEELCS